MSSDFEMKIKVVSSGDIAEVYFYQIPVPCGNAKSKKKNEKKNSDEKRQDNLYRARSNIRHIIWNNQTEYTKFVTLTYKDTVLDVNRVNRDIQTFVQSMRRQNYDMKYLYVLENQRKRGEREGNSGCLHIHMLIFLDKFIKLEDLRKSWKHGFVSIEKIDDVKNLGAYVCKYITKDNITDFGKWSFRTSKKLKRPIEERIFTDGWSENGFHYQPDEILNAIDITYYNKTRHDFHTSDGVGATQTVTYYQGKWKNGNIFTDKDPLEEFKRKLTEYDEP